MKTIIPHWLTKQAEQFPDAIAIENEHGQVETFATLRDKSIATAQRLAGIGVQKGNHVAILSNNCLEMVTLIHALSYIGATIVFLNTRLTSKELNYQLETADVHFLLTTADLREEKQLKHTKQYTFTEIAATKRKEAAPIQTEINLDQAFTMMFTSGTTGFPKAVIHTYGNHWWSAIGSLLNLGYERADKWLLPLPMFHVGGFSILIRSVIYGMTVFLMEKYERNKLLQIINEKDITIASLVTLMLQQLTEDLQSTEKPAKLRTILLGGGAMPTSLLRLVEEKELPVFQSYGMTETSSQIVTLHETHIQRKYGSSGKPLFPAQMKVDAVQGEVGEILVKGPMVFHGYYNNSVANTKSFTDGWFHTGDLGYLDEDGFLYVVDRRTDLIISGGENIYPSEIEHVLLQDENIKETAVVGKADPKWGQVPVAYIVLKDGEIDKIALYAFLEKELAAFKIPHAIHIIDELPRNATNKIMRHRLVE